MKNTTDLIARILISMYFFYEAMDSFWAFDKTKDTMTKYGLTWNQNLLLSLAIVFLIIGATLVLIGYFSGLGAFMLLIYILPVTFIIFPFWNVVPSAREGITVSFMKNLAVAGGLLLLMSNKPGKYSVKSLIYTLRLPR